MRFGVLLVLASQALWCQTATVSATVDGVVKNVTLALKPRSQITLGLGGGTVVAGQPVTLDLSMASTRMLPAALQFELTTLAADVQGVVVTEGPSATAAGKSVTCNQVSLDVLRCVLAGLNATGIENGVVARAAVTIRPGAGSTTTIQVGGVVVTSPAARAMNSTVAPGGGIVTINPLFAFVCSAAEIEPDEDVACTVTLAAPAPSGGRTVNYESSDITKLAVVPAVGTIAAGGTVSTGMATGK